MAVPHRDREPAKADDATSSATIAYEQIRRWILDGEIEPGSRLVVRPLAARLGLSPTPVKVALSALEKAGLLDVVVNAGYSLPHRDPVVFGCAMQLLTEFDLIAVRAILDSPRRVEVVDELHRIVDDQGGSARAGNPAGFELEFHETLWRNAGNPLLLQAASQIRGRALVSSGRLMRAPSVLPQLQVEHCEIVTVLREGRLADSEAAVRRHGENTVSSVTALFPTSNGRSVKH